MGGIVSLLVSAPIILRTAFIGEFSGVVAGIIFALFIPALSIFLGQISGSDRMFEIIFLIICYVMLNTTSFIRLYAIYGDVIIYNAIISIIIFFMLMFSCWMRRIQ